MEILIYTGGMAATHGYVIKTDHACVLFDAPAGINDWLKKENIEVSHLILTHQHWDHTETASKFGDIPIYAYAEHNEDYIMQEAAKRNWNIPLDVQFFQVTKTLTHGDSFTIGDLSFDVLHIPGHSPDSLAFHCEEEEFCIAGDTLFQGGIGRTDFPNGDHEQLLTGIKTHLFNLPKSTTVFPGHGPDTTIAEEIQHNSYLQ